MNKDIDNQQEMHEENENPQNAQTNENSNQTQENTAPQQEASAAEQLEEMKNKYLRIFAEFENYKKRVLKERLELMQTANKEMMISLLPVLDDISRAEKQLKENADDAKSFQEGVQLIFQKFFQIVESKGLQALESIGQEFNTELHEAVTEIPAESEDKKGKVIDELQKGYMLNQKLIRYAKVVVGK